MLRRSVFPLLALAISLVHAPALAAEPPDPLRLVPDQADVVIKIEQPGQIVEMGRSLFKLKELEGFRNYREFLDSTNYRRFLQLVAYYEKKLGRPWPELLDELAGGGVVVAVKFSPQPTPVLLVIQGKDPEYTKQFAKLALELTEQELARQESKARPKQEKYRDIEVIRIGEQAHLAVLGSAIVFSNVAKGLESAIDLHLDKSKKSLADLSQVAEARKLLPAKPIAWAWLNLETVRKAPQAKEVFELPNNQPAIHIAVGGLLDVIRRSPFVAAALVKEDNAVTLTVRMPKGRNGMHEAVQAHVPPPGEPGALPLLEPKGVLYSSSYYLNAHHFWEHRTKLFPEGQIKGLEKFEANSAGPLQGTKFSELLGYAGARQRLVAAQQFATGYKAEPAIRIPSFAWIVELRDPERFHKAVEPPLRGLGFIAGLQANMRLAEEKHGDALIVGYRFGEDDKNKAVQNGILFNFSPCFVRVGNQWIFSSTFELAHNLADVVEKEARTGQPKQAGDSVTVRSRFYWQGLGGYLGVIRDQLVTQTILADGSSPDEAAKQVELLLDLVGKFGSIESSIRYEAERFSYDIRIVTQK